jgi:TfoX/Sxy family transcriptional regulator of competence genes
MTLEETLAADVRAHLSPIRTISEVKMFGGIGFMLNGNMVAAVSKRGLLLRVGKDRYRDALAWPGVRPMEMRGARWKAMSISTRPCRRVTRSNWLDEAVAFVKTLPVKAGGAKPKKPRGSMGPSM